MRAIGLVLLSIAIMALLLTNADAQRRSSAQGNQVAGAKGSWCAVQPRHGGENCGYTSFDQCWATAGRKAAGAAPIHFRARHTGPATPGQVRSAKAAAGLTDWRTRASRRTYVMKTLALLWQIYLGRRSLQIHFRQCGHRCGGGRAMSSRIAWRTAGKVG